MELQNTFKIYNFRFNDNTYFLFILFIKQKWIFKIIIIYEILLDKKYFKNIYTQYSIYTQVIFTKLKIFYVWHMICIFYL